MFENSCLKTFTVLLNAGLGNLSNRFNNFRANVVVLKVPDDVVRAQRKMANTKLASLSATRAFNLNVHVTDLQTQKNIEVNQESHVGHVMLEIVEKLGKFGANTLIIFPFVFIANIKANIESSHFGIF